MQVLTFLLPCLISSDIFSQESGTWAAEQPRADPCKNNELIFATLCEFGGRAFYPLLPWPAHSQPPGLLESPVTALRNSVHADICHASIQKVGKAKPLLLQLLVEDNLLGVHRKQLRSAFISRKLASRFCLKRPSESDSTWRAIETLSGLMNWKWPSPRLVLTFATLKTSRSHA